jgi:hypothetical protein
MKILLILSIFISVLILGKIHKNNIKTRVIIAISFLTSPLILFGKIEKILFFFYFVSLLLAIFYELVKGRTLKYILFSLILIFNTVSILYLTNILGFTSNISIDFKKLYFIDNYSFDIIERFRQNALYLPFPLRSFVYNPFQIILTIIFRIINFIWIPNLISFLGFSILYLIYLSFKKINDFKLLSSLFLITTLSVLHRNPNTFIMYLMLCPSLLIIFSKSIKNINLKFSSIIILISFLYSIL